MRDVLTVRELIQETDLGLELVSEAGLERVIRGIHLSDLEDPSPFMTPGMALLTTGEAFASSPAAGVRLLDRLASLDGAALGVGVGHYFEHVDPAVLAHAARLRIPVFEAPLSVPFRTITSYVYNALASTDMHRLRRSLAVQSHLLDLMIEQPGVERLVTELAGILEADVILFDAGGRVVARAGARREELADTVWAMLRDAEGHVGPLGVLEVGLDRVHARRVVVHGMLERVVAAVIPGSSPAEFVDTALSFAQRLLVLERLQQGEQVIVHRRMRSLLLNDFLAEHGAVEDYVPRLLEQGLTLACSWRVAVFAIGGFSREIGARRLTGEQIYEVKSAFINAVDRFLADHDLPFLSAVRGDSVVALLEVGEREPSEVARVLAEARLYLEAVLGSRRVDVGCSGPAVGLHRGGRQFSDAMEALTMAREGLGVTSRVVLFDEAGGRFRLVEGQSLTALRALDRRLTARLEDYDRLHHTALTATLRTYIDNALSPGRTADALFIHRSTLRKRLQHIETLLGVNLVRMDDVVELHLALRAAELLRAQGAAGDSQPF